MSVTKYVSSRAIFIASNAPPKLLKGLPGALQIPKNCRPSGKVIVARHQRLGMYLSIQNQNLMYRNNLSWTALILLEAIARRGLIRYEV